MNDQMIDHTTVEGMLASGRHLLALKRHDEDEKVTEQNRQTQESYRKGWQKLINTVLLVIPTQLAEYVQADCKDEDGLYVDPYGYRSIKIVIPHLAPIIADLSLTWHDEVFIQNDGCFYISKPDQRFKDEVCWGVKTDWEFHPQSGMFDMALAVAEEYQKMADDIQSGIDQRNEEVRIAEIKTALDGESVSQTPVIASATFHYSDNPLEAYIRQVVRETVQESTISIVEELVRR